MTIFLRLLSDKDKAESLLTSCNAFRSAGSEGRVYQIEPDSFGVVPGAPFAYWVSEMVRDTFVRCDSFENSLRSAKQGLATSNDFRFLRLWWETRSACPTSSRKWSGFAKGGSFSRYYSDIYLQANWMNDGAEIKEEVDRKYSHIKGYQTYWVVKNPEAYFRPGLTWPRRTQGGLSIRAMPQGCIFADKGPAAFVADDAPNVLLALLALVNSQAFDRLVSLQMAFGSYEVGVIQKTPVPDLSADIQSSLASMARRAWSLKRTLDSIDETSHAFVLPATLRARLGDYLPSAIEAELAYVQAKINEIAFDLYSFSEEDRAAVRVSQGNESIKNSRATTDDDSDEEDSAERVSQTDGLLSWAVGVAFGLFDWRLAIDERAVPPEPEPFDPLLAKSPGMMPEGAKRFHHHAGILVEDEGHAHDLVRIVEQALDIVDVPVSEDVRRWLQKDFFPLHFKCYSKSRRKAPIYWPLATTSGSYTLWLYYPSLSNQTLFTAVNDFVDPKLEDVRKELQALRDKGVGRSKQDEKSMETLVNLEDELADLRVSLLDIAPSYRPHHDDGVQITAAPLWKLFRYKPWQKLLKETWAKLEKGDYDWANLAMNYWPERVHEKCVTDKSLAIAHSLEHLYIEPEAAPKKARSRATKQDV